MTDLLMRLQGLPPPVNGLAVYGAVQFRRDVEQIRLMEGPEMDLHATFEVVAKDGSVDFRGPYVQGKRGDRFVYISWGLTPDPDDFGMFRRAKVILDEIPVDLLEAASVIATIEGTSADGGTVCARVRPEHLVWSRA